MAETNTIWYWFKINKQTKGKLEINKLRGEKNPTGLLVKKPELIVFS